MVRIKKYVITILLLCFAGCLCSCASGGAGEYRTVETPAEQQICMAFRKGDRLRETVSAALNALAAEGAVAEISARWFGRDITLTDGDARTAEEPEYETGQRTFIAGLVISGPPMSFRQADKYSGFDAELAAAVCGRLGWELKLRAVSAENIGLELAAGNIDAAWGVTEGDSDEYDLSAPYAENRVIIVVLSRSDIKRTGQLSGKTVGIKYADLELSETLAKLPDGIEKKNVYSEYGALFTALNNGQCDAILTGSLVYSYYLFKSGLAPR